MRNMLENTLFKVVPVTDDIFSLDFQLPPERSASAPPEARGLTRDGVRLMISYQASNQLVHTHFRELDRFLEAGDVLLLNTSETMNAALPATRTDGKALTLHLSTRLPSDLWVVEVREPAERATRPFPHARAGERLSLPGGASATLLTPHAPTLRHREGAEVRLWIAILKLPCPLERYLAEFGAPIRYSYVERPWPLPYYQTVYANERGSAEMPSAGRAFTPELLTRLMAKGVQLLPLLLHTGVASLEAHEPPYEEFYRVSPTTAAAVNGARAEGRRVIAVGTTAVRAIESVTDERGRAHAGEGWTDLVITPARGMRVVDGLLTGLHEPRATHLALLEALAGRAHLEHSYTAALAEGYLWHEFGDLHLILP